MDQQYAFAIAEREYLLRTKKSREMYKAAQRVMPGGDTRTTVFFSPYPITVNSGGGPELQDIDGNRYLDFLNNYTSTIHGHAHPKILQKVNHALTFGTSYASVIEEQITLAEILSERVPGIQRVRFCNSGSEATMFAIRAARAFTNRAGLIKMDGGYHGTHETVQSEFSSAQQAPVSMGIPVHVTQDVYVVPFNDLEAVERLLIQRANEIAAILVEPVMGAAGVIPPQPGYLTGLRELANKYDVILIFDEVQTLRLSTGGAQSKYQVTPDLTALGKIIGGGFPVGAYGGRADIMSLFDPAQSKPLSHGGTFNGNRITMVAGIASMELLDEQAITHLDKLGQRLESRMLETIERFAVPASITRAGSLLNVHFTVTPPIDYSSTHSSCKDLAKLLHLELLNRGIYTAPRGMWNLSTVMTEIHIDQAVEAFSDSMQLIAKCLQQ
ncbi:aspartate aminotransferase family protein [Brevibacillus sp. NRS-1366]|uniref:aspartate aminotransferase family protein n=1 Tax=Brevibacillus sp. NRS-1366 TaxID=3233899 RepID=UPI003D244CC7